ncbi:MAG TPA: hypothetical protein P5277_03605 [Candidatus Paceibacterota bacterium]|nr:hypothetical protein [Candidatus Paceibacterota bacterium]
MKSKFNTLLFSPINIILIIILVIFIFFSSVMLCNDCLPAPGIDCGYCNGCHYQIDCWTKGLIPNSYMLTGIIVVIYLIVFIIIYKFKK